MKQNQSGVLLNTLTFSEMIFTECRFFFSSSFDFPRTPDELRAILFPPFLPPPHLIKAGNSGTQKTHEI